ncbi:MAG: inositol monophosphatase [Flavobacteriales bacterium]|nr:inositol monophosphatase [Flavobacteriales bacterium]
MAFSNQQLKDLTEKVRNVAWDAGVFILTERKVFSTKKVEAKGHNDFVSYVDKESEKLIVGRLKDILPEAGFITEEGTEHRDENPLKWVIDPLDGTTNFIHGMPLFAVSIALVSEKEPLLGVVYEMNQDEMFFGWKNGGAYLNGNRIHVSEAKTVEDSLFGTGFPYYDYHLLDQYLNLFKHLMKHSHGIRRPGSAATDLAYVAAGRFDGFYEYSLSPWDVAAGILLVREAGGTVSDFSGGDDAIFTKEIIATNPHVYKEFLELLAGFMRP